MTQDMTQEVHWASAPALQAYLARQLNHGRLSIFLGAGASVPYGFPDWDKLLSRIAEDVGISFPPDGYPTNPTALTFASGLRAKFADAGSFKESVKRNLYKGTRTEFDDLAANKTFVALGSLVMASARGGVASVITLNYDDCLENYLEDSGFVVDSVSSPAHWASKADITIFHPHGFLPRNPLRSDSESIVLDQLSFSEATNARDSAWYQKLVTIMRNSTVLLIGVGAGDANLMAMLRNAADDHPIGIQQIRYKGLLLQVKPNESSVISFKSHGIYTHTISDYSEALPRFLYGVCRLAADHRRTELGISG